MTFTITQKDFFQKYNINLIEFEQAGLVWSELIEIAYDWIDKMKVYKGKVREITNYLYECSFIHSIRYRIKNPEHLIDKIIRKKILTPEREFTLNNYRKEIKDLGGIRIIHLYKHQNIEISNFIIHKNDFKIGEKIAYLRKQEEYTERPKLEELGFEIKIPEGNKKIYSSLHYIFDESTHNQDYFFEIQVRTIFEEGWAEIDHNFNYPKQTHCNFTKDAIENLNHAVFLCNNLASTVFNLSGNYNISQSNPSFLDESVYQLCKKVCQAKNYASASLLQIELKISPTLARAAILRMEDEKFIYFADGINTPRGIYSENI
jgi:putative GTP pyrophosphokinase